MVVVGRSALRGHSGLAIYCVFVLLVAGCFSASGPSDDEQEHGGLPFLPMAATDDDCLVQVDGLDLQNATIVQMQEAMDAGVTTSLALVDAYIARIEAYDRDGPALNSVRVVHPETREQAIERDEERAQGIVRGPLHGIPVLLKDNIGTNDLPTTAGSIALEENVPPEDATLTAFLREAGAVILGKANLDEFANWMSTQKPQGYSSLGGQVVNAHTMGNPSSSSSGSGVSGSMAFAAVTFGTETSGSILGPAEWNGLVGVKPTVGLVSRAGIIPLAASFDTPGPMARNVHDAAVTLGEVVGEDPRDPATQGTGSRLPPDADYAAGLHPEALQGVRLGYDPSDEQWEERGFYRDALRVLEEVGADLVPIDSHPAIDNVGTSEFALIGNEFKFGINRYLAEEAGPGLPVETLTDIILYNEEHPEEVRYGQDLLIASEATPGDGTLAQVAAVPVIEKSRATADLLFERDDLDALVGPGLAYRVLGAAAGYPTIIVPAGYQASGLPRGLSFFGPAWSEAELLSYAYAYEQGAQVRVPPTTINPGLLDGVCQIEDGPEAQGMQEQATAAVRIPSPQWVPFLG